LVRQYQIGDIIGERFKILDILGGEGISGIGIVYVCADNEQENKNNKIALKTLQSQFLKLEKKIKTFKSEALAWVLLEKSPYIINAEYVINLEGRPFIAIEYIAPDDQGRNTLTDYLKYSIPLEIKLKWSIEVCIAMEHCASRGLSPHRDIKPDNIMITKKGIAKVTDFGLSKFLIENKAIITMLDMKNGEDLSSTLLRITHGEVTGGSVPWMAPEQFEGIPDMKSDIYSLGCVMYQMVNKGKRPFNKFSIRHFYQAHSNEKPKPVFTELWPIIKKCLEKSPEDRYQTFAELRKDLEKLYIKVFGKKPSFKLKRPQLTAKDYFNKGISFEALGFIDEAIREYIQTVKKDPKFFEAYYNLGVLYLLIDIFTFALDEFHKALKLKPDSIDTHKKIAFTYREMLRLSDSIEKYKEILQMNPSEVLIYLDLAEIYETLEDYDNAIESYQKFIDSAPPKFSRDIKNAKKEKRRILKILKKTQKE